MTLPSDSPAMRRSFLHELFAPGWPALAVTAGYVGLMAWVGDLRREHLVIVGLFALGWVASARTRRILGVAAPVFLVVDAFDALRYVRPLFVTADRVHACDLRAAEIRFFGTGADATIADFFAVHHTPAWDVFFSIPYAAFIYVAIVYAITMYFRDRPRAAGVTWAFAIMYLIAMSGWLLFPAAPPWYIRAYGCAIDLSVPPGPAALSRVDTLLGITYFHDFYSRGPTVFGAMPSLHNAYTMFTLLCFWPIAGRFERAAGLAYVVWMFIASTYLDHHWALDALAGWATAAISVSIGMRIALPARHSGAGEAAKAI